MSSEDEEPHPLVLENERLSRENKKLKAQLRGVTSESWNSLCSIVWQNISQSAKIHSTSQLFRDTIDYIENILKAAPLGTNNKDREPNFYLSNEEMTSGTGFVIDTNPTKEFGNKPTQQATTPIKYQSVELEPSPAPSKKSQTLKFLTFIDPAWLASTVEAPTKSALVHRYPLYVLLLTS